MNSTDNTNHLCHIKYLMFARKEQKNKLDATLSKLLDRRIDIYFIIFFKVSPHLCKQFICITHIKYIHGKDTINGKYRVPT